MGNIRKIKDCYYIEFYARGLLYSQVAGNNLEAAQELLRQVEEKIVKGEALTISRQIELADFFERFLIEAREQHTPKTVQRFASAIDHFNSFLHEHFLKVHELAQITPSILESYKVFLSKTQKPKIVNLTILLVRDILEFGIKLGFINDNPSLHLRLLPWPRVTQRKSTARYALARQLLSQHMTMGRFSQLLKLPDIAKGMYFSNLIPLSRDEAYL